MATIRNSIAMQDKMTPVFNKMITAMQSTLSVMEQVNRESERGINAEAFNEANNSISRANAALRTMQDNIEGTNREANRTPGIFDSIGQKALYLSSILNIIKSIISTIKNSADFLDRITQTNSRLNNINDGLQTTDELQRKIYESAQRTGSAYLDVASSVASIANNARDAFSSNDEIVAFAELINKSFVNASTSVNEANAAMLQLTQALGSGVLQGDEFRSIAENAPAILNAVADYLGKSRAEVKALASEGQITAEVLKNSIFAAAEDINKTFSNMPQTFGQHMQRLENIAIQAFTPVAKVFSNIINSESMQKVFALIASSIQFIGIVATYAMQGLGDAINFLVEVFESLYPVLQIGLILLSAYAFTLIPALIAAIKIKISTLWSSAVAWIAQKLAIDMATVSVWGFVTALFALIWPYIAIAAGIMILIVILNQLGVTFDQVIGFIIGLLYSLVSVVYNVVISIINPFLILAQFLTNLFKNPIAAIKMLFLDMAQYVVDQILWVAKALEGLVNLLPGVEVNFTSGLEKIKNMILSTKAEIESSTGVSGAKTLKSLDIGSSFNKGYNAGSNFVKSFDKLSSGLNSLGNISSSQFGTGNIGSMGGISNLDSIGIDGGNLDSVGSIDNDVTITDEDIKLLKDIASTEFVNKYTTLKPTMNVSFGDVKETADVGKILETIEIMTEEALSHVIVEEVG